jgi:hypothetical protein
MAAAAQYLYGDIAPVMAPIATAKTCNGGDLVGISSNTLVKASDTAWDTNLATTQTAFAALFLGIVTQHHTDSTKARVWGNSEDNKIQVATGGFWEMDCASATFTIGQYIGAAKDTGNALLDNKVVGVSGASLAIGVVCEYQPSVTRVKFRLLSTLVPSST